MVASVVNLSRLSHMYIKKLTKVAYLYLRLLVGMMPSKVGNFQKTGMLEATRWWKNLDYTFNLFDTI